MPNYEDAKRTFLNRRDWNSYLSKLQSAASYPKVMEAVKSGRAWFSVGPTVASDWLVGCAEVGSKVSP